MRRRSADRLDHQRVGEVGGLDVGLDIEIAQRGHVDLLAGPFRIDRELLDIPVRAFGSDIAVGQAALGQARADGIALRFVLAALVEEGIAEPRSAAGARLEPCFRLVHIGEIVGDCELVEMRVAEAVIGNDVAGADIAIHHCFVAGLLDLARIDKEGGLLDPRLPERRDEPLAAFLLGKEGADAARRVVEGEGDALLRGRRGGEREQDKRDEGGGEAADHAQRR